MQTLCLPLFDSFPPGGCAAVRRDLFQTYFCVTVSNTPRVVRRSVGMTGSAMNERHERIDAAAHAEGKRLFLGVFQLAVDVHERLLAHDARNLEPDLAEHLAVVEHDDAAAELDDAVGCRRDVLLVRADNDDVVAVVRDGGRHRAGLETVALDVADADVVRVLYGAR